eukprot:Rmarinus@m.29757
MGAGASAPQGVDPVQALTDPGRRYDENPWMLENFYKLYVLNSLEAVSNRKKVNAPISTVVKFLEWAPEIRGVAAKKTTISVPGRLADQLVARVNDSGSISFSALFWWIKWMKHLRKWFDEIVRMFDRNENGTLDRDELKDVLLALRGGHIVTEQELDAFSSQLDANHDGTIQSMELMAYYLSGEFDTASTSQHDIIAKHAVLQEQLAEANEKMRGLRIDVERELREKYGTAQSRELADENEELRTSVAALKEEVETLKEDLKIRKREARENKELADRRHRSVDFLSRRLRDMQRKLEELGFKEDVRQLGKPTSPENEAAAVRVMKLESEIEAMTTSNEDLKTERTTLEDKVEELEGLLTVLRAQQATPGAETPTPTATATTTTLATAETTTTDEKEGDTDSPLAEPGTQDSADAAAAAAASEVKLLRQRAVELEAALEAAQQEKKSLEESLQAAEKNLNDGIVEKDESLRKKEADDRSRATGVANLKAEIASLKAENATLRVSAVEDGTLSTVDPLRERIKDLEAELGQVREEKDSVVASVAEFKTVSERCDSLDRQLHAANAELSKVTKERDSGCKEIEMLQAKQGETVKNLLAAREELRLLSEDTARVSVLDHARMKNRIGELEALVEERDQQIKILEDRLADIQATSTSAQDAQFMRNRIKELESDLAVLRDLVETVKGISTATKEDLEVARRALAERDVEIESLREQTSFLLNEKEVLKTALKPDSQEAANRIRQLESMLSAFQSQMDVLKCVPVTMQNLKGQREIENASAGRVKVLEAEIASLKNRMVSLKMGNTALLAASNTMSHNGLISSDRVKELERDNANLRSQNNSLSSELASFKAAHEMTLTRAQRSEQRMEELETLTAELRAQTSALDASSLNEQNRSLQEEVKQLQEIIESLRTQNRTLQHDLERMKWQAKTAASNLLEAQARVKKYETEARELRLLHDGLQRSNLEMESRISIKDCEISDLKLRVEHLESSDIRLKTLREESDEMSRKLSRATEELISAKQCKSKIENRLADAETELSDSLKRNRDLQGEVESLRTQVNVMKQESDLDGVRSTTRLRDFERETTELRLQLMQQKDLTEKETNRAKELTQLLEDVKAGAPLDADNPIIRKHMSELQESVAKAIEDRTSAEKKLEAAEAKAAAARDELVAMQAKLTTAETRVSTMESAVLEAEAKVGTLQSELIASEAKVTSLGNQLSGLQQTKDAALAEAARAAADARAAHTETEAVMAKLHTAEVERRKKDAEARVALATLDMQSNLARTVSATSMQLGSPQSPMARPLSGRAVSESAMTLDSQDAFREVNGGLQALWRIEIEQAVAERATQQVVGKLSDLEMVGPLLHIYSNDQLVRKVLFPPLKRASSAAPLGKEKRTSSLANKGKRKVLIDWLDGEGYTPFASDTPVYYFPSDAIEGAPGGTFSIFLGGKIQSHLVIYRDEQKLFAGPAMEAMRAYERLRAKRALPGRGTPVKGRKGARSADPRMSPGATRRVIQPSSVRSPVRSRTASPTARPRSRPTSPMKT